MRFAENRLSNIRTNCDRPVDNILDVAHFVSNICVDVPCRQQKFSTHFLDLRLIRSDPVDIPDYDYGGDHVGNRPHDGRHLVIRTLKQITGNRPALLPAGES